MQAVLGCCQSAIQAAPGTEEETVKYPDRQGDEDDGQLTGHCPKLWLFHTGAVPQGGQFELEKERVTWLTKTRMI